MGNPSVITCFQKSVPSYTASRVDLYFVMRTTVLTFLMLFVCAVQTIGQDSGNHSNAHRLSYEEVLARWDHARAFGEARTLPEYCRYMNDLFDTDVYSAGLNDGPWIRFYARGEETFGDATGYVFFGAAVFILFCAWRYLREPLQRAFAPAGPGQTDIPPPSTAISQRDADLCGIGGWLLFLCIWTTIIWPVSAFANLHEVRDDWMYVFVGLILFSIVSGI
jgi:hypothetical protein